VVVEKGSDKAKEARRRTWNAYAAAYRAHYGVTPVSNAKVNKLIQQLVERIGQEDAPQVAAWFVGHRGDWYVKKGHALDCLVGDAEKLHTEWVQATRAVECRAREAEEAKRAEAHRTSPEHRKQVVERLDEVRASVGLPKRA
jgi:hypothetical protein